MNKVYFISGLGADKRVFSFLDLSFCEPVFIDWIPPHPGETLPGYAARLRQRIPEENPVVVGISFGGMLVTEMAKKETGLRGIIISSNKTHTEFPFWLRLGKYLPLYKLSPAALSKKIMLSNTWLLAGRKKEYKDVQRQIIRDSDMKFVKWAISAILQWKNNTAPSNITHIHGTSDKLLPFRFVKPDHIIKNGSHTMTLDKHQEVSELLRYLIGREDRNPGTSPAK